MKSSHDPDYVLKLSSKAEDDIRSIQQYTFETFGEEQVFTYEAILNEALLTIIHNPGLGHQRSDIPSGCRAYLAGQHFIVFRIEEKTV